MSSNLITGLLWFDNDPKKDWRQKVRDALKRHQEKYWLKATVCHVNPQTAGLDKINLNGTAYIETIDDVPVYASDVTLPHHFWAAHPEPKPETRRGGERIEGDETTAQPALFQL